METGTYAKKVNFAEFRADKFVAHFFPGALRSMNGCGSTALGLVTGVNPLSLPRLTDWTRKFMLSFLVKKGFKIVKLTMRNLTNSKELTYPVGGGHVILMRLKFIKNEASWVIIHNGKMFHNFEISDFRGYELINHPVMEAYLIKHPSWDVKFTEATQENIEQLAAKKLGIKLKPRRRARRLRFDQRRPRTNRPFPRESLIVV